MELFELKLYAKAFVFVLKQTKSSAYFTCPICKKSLLQQSYRNHIQFHEDSKKCEVCGSEFARNDYLSSHMRNTHTEEQLRPFCCSVCSKMCATKKALAWHLQRFHKIDDSQSNESALLPEIAPVVSSLPVEKPVKAKISAFKCLPCERSFAGIHYYNMHMKCKHGIKSQQKASANLVQAAQAPPIPDPSVSSTSAMSVNETSSHENEDASADQELDKQYQFLRNKLEVKCNICLKTIKFKYIGRHMELHTKLKKYKCESCDEKFARSDYLSKHVRVYHLKELFCHLCKSQLFKKSAYYKHLLIVHNISEDLANSTMLDQSDTEENVNGYQDEDSSDDEVEMGQNEGEEVQR